MQPNLMRALALCALLLTAALGGCATTVETDVSASRESPTVPTPKQPSTPMATPPPSPTPPLASTPTPTPTAAAKSSAPGHELTTSPVLAASATLSGVRVPLDASVVTLRLAPNLSSLGEHRALIAFDARLANGTTGVLVALPAEGSIRLEGALRGTASSVTLTGTEARRLVTVDTDIFAKPSTQGALDEAMRTAGYSSDAFFSQLLALDATGGLTVTATRLVHVTEQGAYELGSSVALVSVGRMSSTAAAEQVGPSVAVTLEVIDARGHLALPDAHADVRLTDGRKVPLHGDSLLTLAKGSRVKLQPDDGEVLVSMSGRTFQVYSDGVAHLRTALRLALDQTSFTLAPEESAPVAFRLVALDPDADPVITAIRVEGGPERAIVLPGYVPITQQVLDSVGGDPFGTFAIAPALPAFFIADFLGSAIDAIFGPARVTQSLEAGTTFNSVLTVVGDDEPYTATLIVEGNFETTSVTVRVD
jgi:hypothetical protein